MASKNIEIEIQVNIQNPKPLIKFLKKEGKYISEKHQLDEYFTPSHRDFTKVRPINEWLRLRDAESKYSITYKNWHENKQGKTTYCDEFETKIEDIKSIRKIFKVLNFKSLVKVDKIRKTWVYKDYEIAIDSVKGLGEFVEMEYIGKDSKVKAENITKEMINFLKKIDVGKITRNYVGYPFLMMFPKEVKYEIQ